MHLLFLKRSGRERRFAWRLGLGLCCLGLCCLCGGGAAYAAAADWAPVAPLAPVAYGSWTNALLLTNGEIEVVLVPAIGRILRMGRPGQNNLLRESVSQPEKAAPPGFDYGGDWAVPLGPDQSPPRAAEAAPPAPLPPALADPAWQARAWSCADGGQAARLHQTYGDPLHVELTRIIRLPATGNVFTIEQTLIRTAPSTVPVALANWTQIAPDAQDRLAIKPLEAYTNGAEDDPDSATALLPDTTRLNWLVYAPAEPLEPGDLLRNLLEVRIPDPPADPAP